MKVLIGKNKIQRFVNWRENVILNSINIDIFKLISSKIYYVKKIIIITNLVALVTQLNKLLEGRRFKVVNCHTAFLTVRIQIWMSHIELIEFFSVQNWKHMVIIDDSLLTFTRSVTFFHVLRSLIHLFGVVTFKCHKEIYCILQNISFSSLFYDT